MASETETRPWPAASMDMGVWPPDDTEESVVGTNLHQLTITNLRWGINEIARLHTAPGAAVPWQALNQTVVMGFPRADARATKRCPTCSFTTAPSI
ncbi:MAG: hypothetical protein LC769_11875 [Chloroflexi bacterium]|nr:hypothetical protein [Chloroflexota bacterium]